MVLLLAVSLSPTAAFAAPSNPSSGGISIADVDLVDADGHTVNFARDAIADRVVAIDFIYTTCGTICPLVSANFKRLQDTLGKRAGQDVRLISVSLDPDTDTPARIKEYAARYKSGPGWLWLTGKREQVEQVLKGLGTTTANFRDHAPLTVVGDARSGTWTKFNTLVGPQQLRSELDKLLAARRKH